MKKERDIGVDRNSGDRHAPARVEQGWVASLDEGHWGAKESSGFREHQSMIGLDWIGLD